MNVLRLSLLIIVSLGCSQAYGMEREMDNCVQGISDALRAIEGRKLALLMKSEQKPHETLVPMWGADKISVELGDETEKTIATYGLGGCIATAICMKSYDGGKFAGMTHFPPDRGGHAYALAQIVNDGSLYCKGSGGVESVDFFVIVPGKQPDEFVMVPCEDYHVAITHLNLVVKNAMKGQASKIKTNSLAYNMMKVWGSSKSNEIHREVTVTLGNGGMSVVLDKNGLFEKFELTNRCRHIKKGRSIDIQDNSRALVVYKKPGAVQRVLTPEQRLHWNNAYALWQVSFEKSKRLRPPLK
jgi:hypothetical protein